MKKMWITTQNKRMLINSEQIIDIYTNVPGTTIFAETNAMINGVNKIIPLGEYKDKEIGLKILEHLSLVVGSDIPAITMPLNEEVDEWLEGVVKLATIYISNEFRR